MSLRWEPDTCGCILQVADDWLSGEPVYLCPIHQSSIDPFTAVREHNKTKNLTVNKARELAPDLVLSATIDANSNVKIKVQGKKPAAGESRFAQRPEPATEAQKTKLKDDLKAHYGKDIDVS